MKYLVAFFALSVLFASCSGESESQEEIQKVDDQSVKVTGTIKGAENNTIFLQVLQQEKIEEVGQATIDADGNFEITGPAKHLAIHQLSIGNSGTKIIPLTLVPGDVVNVESDFENFTLTPKVTGTDWAKTMTDYMAVYAKFQEGQNALMQKQGQVSDAELTKEFLEIKKDIEKFAIDAINKNPSNAFNIVLTGAITPSMGFEYWDDQYMDPLRKVSEAYLETYKGSEVAASLSNQVYQIELALNDYIANNSGTREAPEIALNNPQGKEIKLSSLRGKYVLVDFWASWCAPCRGENPNVVRLYNKYKDQGFTIYSVSLDKDKASWEKAIKDDGLVWPNHVSDLMQWESPIPQLYGFNGIPYTILLNPEGKIIGAGLRGASLEQKLEEIFSKK